MKQGLEPAASIIARFGGESAVAEITGLALTAPYRWQTPSDKGGTDGRIPRKHVLTLIAHGKENNIEISPDEMLRLVGIDEAAA